MPSTWNDSLKIGISLLDFQHKQLLDQMDFLIEGMEKKKGTQELKSILKFLDMYVNNHFRYEESCMDMYKCPVACKNKNAHAEFINTLEEIKTYIDNERSLDTIKNLVKIRLLNWFVAHIQSIDRNLQPYVKK